MVGSTAVHIGVAFLAGLELGPVAKRLERSDAGVDIALSDLGFRLEEVVLGGAGQQAVTETVAAVVGIDGTVQVLVQRGEQRVIVRGHRGPDHFAAIVIDQQRHNCRNVLPGPVINPGVGTGRGSLVYVDLAFEVFLTIIVTVDDVHRGQVLAIVTREVYIGSIFLALDEDTASAGIVDGIGGLEGFPETGIILQII